jgi:hypothetical protein
MDQKAPEGTEIVKSMIKQSSLGFHGARSCLQVCTSYSQGSSQRLPKNVKSP